MTQKDDRIINKLKPEIKSKWLYALRSEEYKQGKGFLRTGDEYCCLGVLCDLYQKETGNGFWSGTPEGLHYFVIGEEDTHRLPPAEVVDWSGMNDSNPVVYATPGGRYHCNGLGGVNDGGFSFLQIADIIEEQL